MTEVTVDRPTDRYGRSRQPRRGLTRRARIIAVIVLILALIGIAYWSFRPSTTPTTPKTIGYHVVDSASVIINVGIYPDHSRDVHCIVQATNEYDGIVGFTEVTVPADPSADVNAAMPVQVDLATTQLASSGHADSCWFE